MKINLKNLLTRKGTYKVSSDSMDVVKTSYSKVVEQIHNEFLTAGDILLKNANDILNSISIPNEEKVKSLQRFGFKETDQLKKANEIKEKINEQKQISEAVSYYKIKYPNYKYITNDIVDEICKKYGLVLGDVARYKGFVPQKNLNDINKFFDVYPNEEMAWISTSKINYEKRIVSDEEYNKYSKYEYSWFNYEKVKLSICAPLEDMDTSGMMVYKNRLIKIPDPIVLLPKNHVNGVDGYLILTAWGNEASDELVVNQLNN